MPDTLAHRSDELHHDSLLDVLRAYWAPIVIATILCGMIGYGFSHLVSPEYRATTTLYLRDPSAEGVFGQAPALGSRTTRIFTEARQTNSEATLGVAAASLEEEFGVVNDLSRRISVDPISDLSALRITATGPTPERAVAYVEAVSTAYREATSAERRGEAEAAATELEVYAQQLGAELAATDAALAEATPGDADTRSLAGERDALYAELLAARRTTHQLRVDAEIAADPVYRIDPAEEPKTPFRPQRQLNAGLAALIGLIGTIALASWYDERGGPTHHPDKPRALLDRPLLATLPDATLRPAVTRSSGGRRLVSWDAEMTSALQRITLAVVDGNETTRDGPGRVILVSSPHVTDRTAEAVLGAGLVAAQSDRRVLLVDADLADRRLARIATGSTPTARGSGGSVSVLTADVTPPVVSPSSEDPNPSLRVFAMGTDGSDPFGFLASPLFAEAIEQIRSLGDLVLVYAPSPLDAPESVAMSRTVDGVILHIADGTPVSRVAAMRPLVEGQRIPLLGYVFDERPHNWGTAPATGWLHRRREAARPRPAVTLTTHRLRGEA